MKKLFTLLIASFSVLTLFAQITEEEIKEKNYQEINPFGQSPGGFSIVDKWAMYPNGQNGVEKLIVKNLQYPEEAQMKKIEGQVIIGYTVQVDGTIDEIKVVQSAHPLLDAEAIRVIKLMELWVPTMQKGKTVKTAYQQPINFKL